MVSKRRGAGFRKVVKEEQLEQETHAGWRLVEVLGEEEVVISAPRMSSSGYAEVAIAPIAVTRHKFLLALDEESAIAKLNQELTQCKNELGDAKASERNALVDRTRLEGEVTSARRQLSNEKQSSESYQKQYNDERDRNRKYENDISAIRSAIGTERMNEILGTKPCSLSPQAK